MLVDGKPMRVGRMANFGSVILNEASGRD